ncbi:MAG: PEGA domain-containing protein [Archangium sp.]|nr:PEGA domain-containing protein [Archangium sp.]MDP3157046.1 PEGA domain-containing protein [Archangium sp.]MDP3575763.1 PEGA domain-containing protein [Archangium sp.]
MLSVLVVAAAVTAAGPKIAIVDVDAPDLMMGLGAQVTRAIVTEAQAQKLDVMLPDQVREKMDARRYETLKKCAGNVACAAQELESLGVKRAVLGRLTRDERNYILKLWLFDVSALTVIADVDRSILIAARRFQKDVEQAVPPLLRGEREARGTLVVQANLADAQVTLNGEFAGTPPLELTLKPGKYEVKLERNKYLPITRLVAVEANQETKLELKLLLIPGMVPDEQVVPALTRKPDGTTAPPVQLSALTWILGATTLATAGTGLAFGLIARGQQRTLTEGYDAEKDLYQGTRAAALEQNRNALVANVAFGVAGAALIGTVISGIVDGTRAPAVQITPTVTPNAAGLTLGGTF